MGQENDASRSGCVLDAKYNSVEAVTRIIMVGHKLGLRMRSPECKE